ncbi:zinc finger protein 883-like isoform X2 [Ischnura elegans]|uniref:zinc finger protein 883-like isoform X2 n=1 Tax=Ischnura elegans TaxID=197161 RepID=UPI001ED87E8F|nr:zinc finger protein 883-like isoform X2 [Ischnura elegans]
MGSVQSGAEYAEGGREERQWAGGDASAADVAGEREELTCAVCEHMFADMPSLRRHLPCRSSSGVTLAAASDFTEHWERHGGEAAVKSEEGVNVSRVTTDEVHSGNHARGGVRVNNFAYRRGGMARGGRGRRIAIAARNAVAANRKQLSGNFTIDKKVSFQCDMCRHGFSRLELLKKHIQSHSEEGGYACPICKKSFRTRWSLKNHRKSHQKVSQYECPICGRKFSRPQHLEAHRATHGTGTEYQCGICRKTFPQSSYLETHLRTTHSGQEVTQCHICGKRFSNKNVLKVHLRVHMDIKPFRCERCERRFAHKPELARHQLLPCEADPSPVAALGPYRCRLCGEAFHDAGSLTQHMAKHREGEGMVKPDPDEPPHSAAPSEPRVIVHRESLNTGISYEEDEEVWVKRSPRHPEYSDSETTGTKASVEGDVVSSLEEASDPTYRPPSETAERIDSSNSKVRPFKCQICHKCFGEKWELVRHQRVHTQSNPHECSACGKRFTETVNLRKHMLVHADSRPFDCPFCAKPFALRKNLKRHLELESCLKRLDFNTSELGSQNNGGGGDEGTSSSSGGARSEQQGAEGGVAAPESNSRTLEDIMAAAKEASVEVYLEQEGSVSRVFPCTFCEKTFLRTDQLKKHLMVHGGIKPHACTLCSRRFTEKGNLSKHMKTHAYEKPYPCKYCEKAYTQKKNLERHLLTHQDDDNDEAAG